MLFEGLFDEASGSIDIRSMSEKDHESNDDLAPVPDWVLEAENLYLSRKLNSYSAVAQHLGVNRTSMAEYAKKRDWAGRKRKVEADAARKLMAKIDEDAAQEQADTFTALTANTIQAGLRASVFLARYGAMILEEQSKAIEKRKVYTPPVLPAAIMQMVQMAMDLRPREEAASIEIARIGELLNPRR